MDKGAAAEAEDWLSLQLAEVEILQSIYPDEVTVQEQRAVSSDAALPLFEVIVGKSPSVCVTLQRGYPTHGSLGLRWREGGGLSNKQKEEVLSRVQRVCEGQEGGERLLAVVQEFYEALADCDEAPADHESCPKSGDEKLSCQDKPTHQFLGRRLIYFHHIINSTKRETVMRAAVDLKLGGYSKIGWPGVVVVEGPEESVIEYVRKLQGLRWQQMTVRGEELIEIPEGKEVDDVRALHKGFEELGERDMSLLAQRLREAGLEELLKTLFK